MPASSEIQRRTLVSRGTCRGCVSGLPPATAVRFFSCLPGVESRPRSCPMDPALLQRLRAIVGPGGVISEPEQLHTYECDGLTNFRVLPAAVALPRSREQVQQIVSLCHEQKLPFVARGSGTGLSGGALPVETVVEVPS